MTSSHMNAEMASQLMPVVEAALSISRNSEAMDALTRVANDPGSVASGSNSSSTQSVVLDVLYKALQQNKQRGLCYRCKQEVFCALIRLTCIRGITAFSFK